MKSNLPDPHLRTVTIPDIHRVLFASAYNFNTGESNRDSINVNIDFWEKGLENHEILESLRIQVQDCLKKIV